MQGVGEGGKGGRLVRIRSIHGQKVLSRKYDVNGASTRVVDGKAGLTAVKIGKGLGRFKYKMGRQRLGRVEGGHMIYLFYVESSLSDDEIRVFGEGNGE